ncbi:MAG: hypothetical protein ACYCUW_06660 [bacterium]
MEFGINNMNFMLSAIQKIRITFLDASKDLKPASGTGFWVMTEKKRMIFVTNKHNLEQNIYNNDKENYDLWKLKKIEIDFRFHNNENNQPYTNLIPIDCTEWERIYDDSNNGPDVAILFTEPLMVPKPDFGVPVLQSASQYMLANLNYLNNELQIGDSAYFIGFPGLNLNDGEFKFPIIRHCGISSYPLIDFTDEVKRGNKLGIPTKETCLVNGLSISGSSGSPIFSYQKGIKAGPGIETAMLYREPRLIGIMSGRWDDKTPPISISHFKDHTGLSYFTKSTAILNLINRYDL